MDESEDSIAGGKRIYFTQNKTNKQKLPHRGKTDWLDWTGLDWTGHKTYADESTYGNEPTWNCKHKEIIKGANEEGNEGEQLRKINQ